MLLSVPRRRGRENHNNRSSLQGVQKPLSQWMSLYPSLIHPTPWSHVILLTSCLVLDGMWIVEHLDI